MQIAPSVPQPVASIESAFDRSCTQSRSNLFPQYSPAGGVVLSHSAGHAHTQDLVQMRTENLVYRIRVNKVENPWLQPIDGSAGRQIANFPAEHINMFHRSSDGKRPAMLRGHTASDMIVLRDAGAPQ